MSFILFTLILEWWSRGLCLCGTVSVYCVICVVKYSLFMFVGCSGCNVHWFSVWSGCCAFDLSCDACTYLVACMFLLADVICFLGQM